MKSLKQLGFIIVYFGVTILELQNHLSQIIIIIFLFSTFAVFCLKSFLNIYTYCLRISPVYFLALFDIVRTHFQIQFLSCSLCLNGCFHCFCFTQCLNTPITVGFLSGSVAPFICFQEIFLPHILYIFYKISKTFSVFLVIF